LLLQAQRFFNLARLLQGSEGVACVQLFSLCRWAALSAVDRLQEVQQREPFVGLQDRPRLERRYSTRGS